jgi:hypothetical protein
MRKNAVYALPQGKEKSREGKGRVGREDKGPT